jgi:hypothetical protein
VCIWRYASWIGELSKLGGCQFAVNEDNRRADGSGLACISLYVGHAVSAGRAFAVLRRKWRVHQSNGSGKEKEENASIWGALSISLAKPPSIISLVSSDLEVWKST